MSDDDNPVVTTHEVPQWLTDIIERHMRSGVSISLNETLDGINGIIWQPGDENVLASAIIKNVTHRVVLDLNGHLYSLEPLEDTCP